MFDLPKSKLDIIESKRPLKSFDNSNHFASILKIFSIHDALLDLMYFSKGLGTIGSRGYNLSVVCAGNANKSMSMLFASSVVCKAT